MMRSLLRAICSLGVISLFLYAGYWWLSGNDSGYRRTVETPLPRDVADNPERINEVPLLKDMEMKEADVTKEFSIDVTYPEVVFANAPDRTAEANDVITTFVKDFVADWKAGFDTPEDSAARTEAEKSIRLGNGGVDSLVMRWSTLLSSPTIISIRFDYSYYQGTALHAMSGSKIFNFDIERRRELHAEDMFASSTMAYSFLSVLTREQLKKQLADITEDEWRDTVLPGTAASSTYFQNVGVTKTGLVVIFDPYQVASFARGSVVVHLPFEDIGATIAPRIRDATEAAKENYEEARPLEES